MHIRRQIAGQKKIGIRLIFIQGCNELQWPLPLKLHIEVAAIWANIWRYIDIAFTSLKQTLPSVLS